MATDQRTIAHLLERLEPVGKPVAKNMFGEFGIYLDGVFVGVVCNDTFFLKITKRAEALAEDLEREPPYNGAKPSFRIPADLWEEEEWFRDILQASVSALRK